MNNYYKNVFDCYFLLKLKFCCKRYNNFSNEILGQNFFLRREVCNVDTLQYMS
jgi:hypothetical protein